MICEILTSLLLATLLGLFESLTACLNCCSSQLVHSLVYVHLWLVFNISCGDLRDFFDEWERLVDLDILLDFIRRCLSFKDNKLGEVILKALNIPVKALLRFVDPAVVDSDTALACLVNTLTNSFNFSNSKAFALTGIHVVGDTTAANDWAQLLDRAWK